MVLDKLQEKVGLKRPERIEEAWNRLHKEGAFIPIYNSTDTETRRAEVKEILDKVGPALFDMEIKKQVVQKTFQLFFCEGDPWYRGLDNRELAEKVSCFLMNCTEVGYMNEFLPDLFEEAMHLLSLSWQALDVTNTPAVIIESRPVVTGEPSRSPERKPDALGNFEIREHIQALEEENRMLREQRKK